MKKKSNKLTTIILPVVAIIIMMVVVVMMMGLDPSSKEVPLPGLVSAEGEDILVNLEKQYRELNPNIKGVLLEFSDFECPFCATAQSTVGALRTVYGDTLPVVFMHFPLEQIHPHAFDAATAAVCAKEQGKFWKYHDLLYENNQNLDMTSLLANADVVGLDKAQFTTCLSNGTAKEQVKADQKLGRMLGIQGTPTFVLVVNGTVRTIEGVLPVDQFVKIVESME
jgi:protein-disulfide isomerase